jgi:hypothetical protein
MSNIRFISTSSNISQKVGIGLSSILGPTGPQGPFGGPQGYQGPQGVGFSTIVNASTGYLLTSISNNTAQAEQNLSFTNNVLAVTGTLLASTIGIATGSPTFPLDVNGSVSVGSRLFMQQDTSGVNGNSWIGIPNGVEPNNLAIGFSNTGSSKTVDHVKFYTFGNERLKILSDGNVLIGYPSSNGSYKLQVNSQIFATNSTIATSDLKYKENIIPITGALSIIEGLNPVSYNWKPHPLHNFAQGDNLGFIAQEVQETLKDTTYVDNIVKSNQCKYTNDQGEEVVEDFLGIAEGHLIPLLSSAVKEQSIIIKKQQLGIQTLQIQVKSLQDQINAIIGGLRDASSFEEYKSRNI